MLRGVNRYRTKGSPHWHWIEPMGSPSVCMRLGTFFKPKWFGKGDPMKHASILGAAILLVAGTVPAFSQMPTVSGDIQIWYTQMMDDNLRLNSTSVTPNKYYNLRSEFQEDGFTVRRAELKISGSVIDSLLYEAMIDPSISTTSFDKTKPNGSYNPMILQDADILWKAMPGLDVKVGQFKTLQTYEGNISSTELLFAERSQLGRVFGDKRDRGIVASYSFGDPQDFSSKISAGVFNGMSDLASGKANDTNAQKDFIARLDFTAADVHKFGIYTLQGSTDQGDKGSLKAYTFTGIDTPTTAEILDNKDKTTNIGAFYVFQSGPWQLSAEYITGLIGRRAPSVYDGANTPASTASLREYLDQKFEGYYLTAGYTFDHHTFVARYDVMNYNKGNDWYTATNPYVKAGTDYTPKYTETTLGYTYAWKPEKVKAANFKINYIARSKNFLKPLTTIGQTSEQGGDTIVAALQVAF
jgi:Phosphate-selective porin O and P